VEGSYKISTGDATQDVKCEGESVMLHIVLLKAVGARGVAVGCDTALLSVRLTEHGRL